MMLREHAFEPITERRLFSMEIPSAAALPQLALPSGNFVCLLAWNARDASPEAVSAFVDPLLRTGASYFVCWGPDCERVHDIIDGMIDAPDNTFGVPEGYCIMTTWHSSEPLHEALFYFLVCSWPDEPYEDSTHTALAISIGSPSWAAEIAEALDEPKEWVRHYLENDAG